MSVTGFFSLTILPAFSLSASASPVMTTTPLRRSGRDLGRERRAVRQHEVRDPAVVVGPFGAVDERAALDGDPAAVGLDGLVGHDPPDGHGQAELDDVAGLPGPGDEGIALIEPVRSSTSRR